jgi:rhomboid family GlyGly-CTERM serine protease
LSSALPAKFRPGSRAGLLLALAVLCITQFVPGDVARLRYERTAVAAGEWWRLLSCHLIHYDALHLAMNLAGLVLLWLLYARDARARDWCIVALASALAIGGGLYFIEPDVAWYLGLSGVLHGVWAAGGIAACRRWPLEGGVTLALLAGKLAFELVHGPVSSGFGATLPVLTVAHRLGALGGLGAAVALRLWRRSLY